VRTGRRSGTGPPWRTGTVEHDGEQIYVEVTGESDAPTVVLTHGAGGSHAAWFQQVPVLAQAGYRVLTWDSRGFGNSSCRSGLDTDAAVRDLAAVLDATDTGHAHLVGQSMGGWWVTAFTVAHPDRVLSLTLSNTIGGLWTEALDAHLGTLAPDAAPRLGHHPALGPDTDVVRAFLYQQLNTFHDPPMADVLRALVTTRLDPRALDATGVDVLVVSGRDDSLFPSVLVAESTARLARARFVEIAGAGHSPYFERPDDYNAALLGFLAAH
jgi:pimeloyl-ACP methyl ester carboxylesterase